MISSLILSNFAGLLPSVDKGKRCFGPSYCYFTSSSFFFLRSYFSLSISAKFFLKRFLGTGFDLISRTRASGYGITFGFGFVKLKGFYSVIFFGLASSAAI
jgi:hypothetical protein